MMKICKRAREANYFVFTMRNVSSDLALSIDPTVTRRELLPAIAGEVRGAGYPAGDRGRQIGSLCVHKRGVRET